MYYFFIFTGIIEVVKELIAEYGDIFKFWLGNDLNVFVSNPEDIKVSIHRQQDNNNNIL